MAISGTSGNVMEPLDFQSEHRPAQRRNVADAERLLSTVAGGALAGWSLLGRRLRPLPLLAGASLIYRGLTGQCSVYRALGINTARSFNPAVGVRAQHGCKVEQRLAIQRPAEELYHFWRQPDKLAQVLGHVRSIEAIDDRRTHWVAEAPLGGTVEWDAEIINQREPELIAWRSLPGSQVDTAGSVHFESLGHGRGTMVTVSLKYEPPGGKITAAAADLFGAGCAARIKEDLYCFKNMAEAGEIPTTQGQPRGS